MLAENKLKSLAEWAKGNSKDELIWASGYLAGLAYQSGPVAAEEVTPAVKVNLKPTIVYATETGNSKKLAVQLQTLLKKNKIQAKVSDAFQYPLDKIEKEEFLIVIMSTQGEGEPPQNAQKFYDNLGNLSKDLSKIQYAVLGLGDSSYPFFCRAGEVVDQQLQRLQAKQVLPYQKADVNYQPVAEEWFAQVLQILQNQGTAASPVASLPKQASVPDGKKSYTGTIKHKVVLNDVGSNKQTFHIEIISEDELDYEPGDVVGFYPKNSAAEIAEIGKLLGMPLDASSLEGKNIKGLSKKSLQQLAELFEIEITEERADLIDILEKYPQREAVELSPLLERLHPVAPRLYSISSDKEAHDGELHITVTLNKFHAEQKAKKGFCSSFLEDYPVGGSLSFYIQKNLHFKLPEEDKDVIMIGPGTGIAPFRSFLAHRDVTGAEGRNWLFFGEQHFVSDFYYQTEIQEWLSTGVLTKLETAFSRDQKQKVYVQDRIRERGEEFAKWLADGAYLYVCGQKEPMSRDVENTIVEVLTQQNDWNKEEASAFLETLEIEGRYLKDVY
jgi:sulfite reductase (NADPH) flavoprotein alpha-component